MSQGGLEILCWIEKRLFFCQKSKLNFCPWLFYRQREGSGLLFKCLFNCCVYDDDDAGFGVTENYLHCGEWKNLLRQHYQILNRTSPIIQNQSIYQNIDGSTHVWPDFQEYLVWSQASHVDCQVMKTGSNSYGPCLGLLGVWKALISRCVTYDFTIQLLDL